MNINESAEVLGNCPFFHESNIDAARRLGLREQMSFRCPVCKLAGIVMKEEGYLATVVRDSEQVDSAKVPCLKDPKSN